MPGPYVISGMPERFPQPVLLALNCAVVQMVLMPSLSGARTGCYATVKNHVPGRRLVVRRLISCYRSLRYWLGSR